MDNDYTYERKEIEICDVDYMGEYQLCHLFNRFAHIATENAIKLGFWNEDMMDQYGWVVTKQSLHLDQPIHYQDVIELSTIPDNGSFVSFPRYYYIKKDNKEIGYCSSIWTLLDIQKRRITSPKKAGIKIPQITCEHPLQAPKPIDIDLEMKYQTTRQVLYSDVDTNQHMNNTRYLQWAFDLIDYNIYKDYFVSDLNIQYHKEIMPLQMVDLYMAHQDHRYLIVGKNEDNIYFTIEIYFKERANSN